MRGGTYFGHVTEHVCHRAVPADRPRGQLRPHRLGRRARPVRRDHRVPGRRAARLVAAGRAAASRPSTWSPRSCSRIGVRAARAPRRARRRWPSGRRPGRAPRDHRRGAAARHPGRTVRRPEPAAPRLGQPPPAGLGRDDRPDRRRRHRHRRGQAAHPAAARRGRGAGRARRRGRHRRARRSGCCRARRAGRGQAAARPAGRARRPATSARPSAVERRSPRPAATWWSSGS